MSQTVSFIETKFNLAVCFGFFNRGDERELYAGKWPWFF